VVLSSKADPVAVLNQTVEFLIIAGAAIGSLLAGTPTKVLAALANCLKKTISGSGYSKADYMELFNMLYGAFSVLRKNGEMALEKDVDNPNNSEIFKKYPKFLANHAAQSMMLDSWSSADRPAPTKLSHLMMRK
jgi:chemotaxis protein MotA